jgi:hypothetical protein
VAQVIPARHNMETKRLTTWGVSYAVDMSMACALSYAIITQLLVRFVDEPTKLLGGMWAVVATVFVFRDSRASSLFAGIARLFATCVKSQGRSTRPKLVGVDAVDSPLLNGIECLT